MIAYTLQNTKHFYVKPVCIKIKMSLFWKTKTLFVSSLNHKQTNYQNTFIHQEFLDKCRAHVFNYQGFIFKVMTNDYRWSPRRKCN